MHSLYHQCHGPSYRSPRIQHPPHRPSTYPPLHSLRPHLTPPPRSRTTPHHAAGDTATATYSYRGPSGYFTTEMGAFTADINRTMRSGESVAWEFNHGRKSPGVDTMMTSYGQSNLDSIYDESPVHSESGLISSRNESSLRFRDGSNGPFQRVLAWGIPSCSYTPPFRLHPLTGQPSYTSTIDPSYWETQWYDFDIAHTHSGEGTSQGFGSNGEPVTTGRFNSNSSPCFQAFI
ncbi:hypothetical protein M422DRAFT_242626 [Sphaerobolus stellatus SS14]|nr:hypothetical protein M422DRAFT_242626 [Sphaerobolus stellatus SS14]